MALISVPHHRKTSGFDYKIKFDANNLLLAQRGEGRENKEVDDDSTDNILDLKYIDVLICLLYSDNNSSFTSLQNVIRALLYTLSQFASAEDIKESLSLSQTSIFGEGNIFLDSPRDESSAKYFNLIKSLLSSSVVSELVGQKKLFEKNEDIQKFFIDKIELLNEINSNDSNGDTKHTEEEKSTSMPMDESKKKKTSNLIKDISDELSKIESSSILLSFVNNINSNFPEQVEMTKEEKKDAIFSIMSSIDLIIPQISQEYIDKMIKMINEYIDTRTEVIMAEEEDGHND